jgi:transposase InsO family protein
MPSEFERWLCSIGVKHKYSAPHVHQQNGQAEWIHCTIHTKMQSIQKQACILDGWWEFTILHAVKIYNQMPVS